MYHERVRRRSSGSAESEDWRDSPGRSSSGAALCFGWGHCRGSFLALEQVFQLGHELLHVFEIQVNRREAHVGHLINLAKAVHDELADLAALAFAFDRINDEAFGLIDDLLQPA